MNPFDPNYMFTTPTANPPGVYIVIPVLFGLLLVASIVVYFRRTALTPNNPPLRRLLRRMSGSGVWIGSIGLFLAIMRYLQILYLAMPIWMYLLVLAAIITVGYYVYELSERYPLAIWQMQQRALERRYQPVPQRTAPRRARPVPNPRTRGKRRR